MNVDDANYFDHVLQVAMDFSAGAMSAVVAKSSSAPMERIKLLLQTQHINRYIIKPYTGIIDCGKRIYVEEGISAFWRGNLANIYRYVPANAMSFAFKDGFRRLWKWVHTPQNDWQMMLQNFTSAGLAGASVITITYPFDMARTKLAVDVGRNKNSKTSNVQVRRYTGPMDCLKQTVAAGGIRAAYSGYTVSLVGVVIFRSLHMGGYDTLKTHYDLEHAPVYTRFAIAQAVTTTVGTACYPIDTMKRRLMIGDNHYKGAVDCAKRILAEEGWRGFFKGLSANLVRGVAGAVLLVGYDEAQKVVNSGVSASGFSGRGVSI